MRLFALSLTSLSLLAAPSDGQQALLARQSLHGLDLLGVDEITHVPSLLLNDVTFLPLDVAGLPPRDVFRLGRPVPVGAEGPAPRIRLPSQGSLYRVARAGHSALLRATTDGTLDVLLERPDVGGQPVLGGLVGVSPDGSRALLLESTAAGDALWALDLDASGVPLLLTAGLAGLAVDSTSLRVGPSDAWFLADGVLQHADLAAAAPALPFDLGLSPGEIVLPEPVMSDAGTRLALVTETLDGMRHLRVADRSGTSQVVANGALHGACLTSALGPLVALSPAGTSVAWTAAVTVGTKTASELFVARVDLPPAPTQVTADLNFTDTIDNVGILGFKAEGLLTFLAGEQAPLDPALAVGAADVFGVDPTAPSTIANLSQTSGDLVQPFLAKGALEVQELFLDPLGERMLLIVDPDDGDFGLVLQDAGAAAPPTTLVTGLDGRPELSAAGEHLLVLAAPSTAFPTQQQLLLVPPAGDPQGPRLLATAPVALRLDRFTSSRDPSRSALVASVAPEFELPILVDLPTGTLLPVWTAFLAVTPALAFTPSGSLALGVGLPGGPFVFAGFSAPLAAHKYPIPVGFGFPLDG